MTTATDKQAPPRWLDDEEMAAWLPLIRVVSLLPQALDRQLREEVGISHTYYQMMALLSAQPDRTASMGDLARLTTTSPSRLSHAVTSMEQRGWLRRDPCASDRRVQYATLTDEGFRVLEAVAPTHVAEVRRRVFDHLTSEQVRQLRSIGTTLLAALEDDATPSAAVQGD
jgi:DNA-binding MarR family transcriptional regulator